jgi:hypothetical protein
MHGQVEFVYLLQEIDDEKLVGEKANPMNKNEKGSKSEFF